MRITWTSNDSTWRLRIRLDPEDSLDGHGQGRSKIQLVTNECVVRLPESAVEPHPDLLALAAFLVTSGWTRQRISFCRPISSAFAQAVARAFRVEAGPVDDMLPARDAGNCVGLSYSGGADSVALSEVVSGSPHVHFQRMPHSRVPNRATHFRSDIAADLARKASQRGRNVLIVRSDLEYLCLPWPQFPAWPAVAIGAVLLADDLDLGSVGFGSPLESRYLADGRRFVGGGSGPWATLFAAVGLPFFRPVAGLTEVGTLRLALESDLSDLVRSCNLGGAGGPCFACPKCLRKDLIAAAIEGRELHPALRRRMAPGDPVLRQLEGEPPYYFQSCLEWALARAPGLQGTPLGDLASRLGVTEKSTEWAGYYYPRALSDEVPAAWRPTVSDFMKQRIGWMTEEQVEVVETWDAAARATADAGAPR